MHPLAHLISGFIGESDRQNARPWNAVRLDQVRDAMRDHARLAASGARQQQQRSFDVRDSRLLLWIEALEKIHEKEGAT
jgi:hypothetical protein